ncbi:MAG: site-specific integrase, partial [Desulfovibrionaceae bacterium]|nr:site-specific integrase [Desulfovibrionaceae bacterium]
CYLPHAKQHKRSWKVDERIARQHISETFGKRSLTGITRTEVEEWFRSLPRRKLAPATCNRILAVFKAIYALAASYKLLPDGQKPCSGVSAFKVSNKRERYLSDEEARRLVRELELSPHREAVVIRLLLLTGARKNEILKARWEDVHPDRHLLTVPLSKSGKPRHIALSDEAVKLVRSIPRRAGNPWLFPGHAQGKPLSDVYGFWNRLRCRLGFPDVRIHDLRHTFASLLVNAGRTLYEVQMLLGHSDPRTTMRYAHLGKSTLVAAAQTVSGYLAGLGQSSGRITRSMPVVHKDIRRHGRASPIPTGFGR